MKTILFLITILVFGWCSAWAQTPNVALKLSITNGAKVFTTAHVAADNTIPTGAGDIVWAGYLLEEYTSPDTTLETRLGLVSQSNPTNVWTVPIRQYALTFDYRGAVHSVLGTNGLTFNDLSGLGICYYTPNLEFGFIRIESCVGTSNGTGVLGEMVHSPTLDFLVNDGVRQLQVVLAEATDAATGDDLLNGVGCDPTGGGCAPLFDLDLSFTLTHHGRNPAYYGFGNGPKMKADSATMQAAPSPPGPGLCNPATEIACTDETFNVSCRQPHICNTWGDADGDNLVGSGDVLTIGGHALFNTGLDAGPDDAKLFDPSPFSP